MLASRCREQGERKHPVEAERTITERFLQEGQSLRVISRAFDGYVEQMMHVSSTCLVRIERNRYSVPAVFSFNRSSKLGVLLQSGISQLKNPRAQNSSW